MKSISVWPVLICVLSMLAASAVASLAWGRTGLNLSLSCSGDPAQGANVLHATGVAFFGGIVSSILIVALRRRRVALVAAVLLAAGLLSVALIFVALDSATYIQLDRQCSDFGFGALPTRTGHIGYVYVVWGGLLAVLLVETLWIAKRFGYLRRSLR